MKFQSVFIIFNILLVVFLAILLMSPALFTSSQLAGVFWKSNWILIIVLGVILIGFDIFYFTNRRLYALLEKEDWPALTQYLEDRIIRKGKYTPRLVRLLANTYLVLSDSPGVMSLENKAAVAKPSLIEENALVFGTARILGKDITGAIRFFESRLQSAKADIRPWIHWYYSFSLLLNRQYEKASEEFSYLARSSRDGVIAGLSAYFLGSVIMKSMPAHRAILEPAAEEGRERVRASFPRQLNWAKEVARIKAEIHTAVLTKYMDEAGIWLYQ